MKIKAIFFGLFLVGFAFAAQAQTATPKVSRKQVNQQKRIKQGVRSGELTGKEVYRLEKQQLRINRGKKMAKADGVVTPKERARIHTRQNKASRNIYRQKNDKQRRR